MKSQPLKSKSPRIFLKRSMPLKGAKTMPFKAKKILPKRQSTPYKPGSIKRGYTRYA